MLFMNTPEGTNLSGSCARRIQSSIKNSANAGGDGKKSIPHGAPGHFREIYYFGFAGVRRAHNRKTSDRCAVRRVRDGSSASQEAGSKTPSSSRSAYRFRNG
jgi:hypothetical protein